MNNKLKLTLIILLTMALYSCVNSDENAKDVVDEFLKEANSQSSNIDPNLMTKDYIKFFSHKKFYISQSWELTSKKENDTLYSVTSKSKTINSSGQSVEILQMFSLTNGDGRWKIFDSSRFIVDEMNLQIVGKQWDFYTDLNKDQIFNELKQKLKLKVIEPGHNTYFFESRKGKLKLVNNSDYDITGVKILIEHFDEDGKSVNTDHKLIYNIIRKHGYREFDWYTSDCLKCLRQEFKISMVKENP